MAREHLHDAEIAAIAAAIGTIGDTSLRRAVASKIKMALDDHAPWVFTADGERGHYDWAPWLDGCRISN